MPIHTARQAKWPSQSVPTWEMSGNSDRAIDARYGKIGIAAVAAAVRYTGDARNITNPAAPTPSNIVTTDARRMENPPKPVYPEPHVHVFCPNCGELTNIRAMGPTIDLQWMDEITYSCAACGTETKVQLPKHLRIFAR